MLTHFASAMAEGTAEGDAHMEELVGHVLGMEETAHGFLRRRSLKESFHSDSLLAPDTDFMTGISFLHVTCVAIHGYDGFITHSCDISFPPTHH